MRTLKISLLVFILSVNISAQNFWQCSLSGLAKGYVTFYEEENIILVAGVTGIHKSTNDGVNWITWTNGIIPDIAHMSKNDSNITFAATFLGVYRSTNIGTSWDTINNGFLNLEFIRVFPENERVFAGNLSGEIYKSTNSGDSWNLIKQLPPYNELFAYTSNDNYIFLGINSVNYDSGGVLRSSDEGATWQAVNYGLLIPSVRTLAKNGQGELFAGSTDGIYISSDNGNLWNNINNGANWELINSGLYTVYVYSVNISPTGHLFACTYELPFACGLHKSVMPVTDVGKTLDNNLNPKFNLSQNYPNPFNPVTKISWQSPVGSWQTLKIYDMLGNEVAILVDEYKPAGDYEIEFSAKGGSAIGRYASGVYFYQLRAGEYTETKKMVLIR
jgi:photosystem II stability/assembly factor-like uncharacterized protein